MSHLTLIESPQGSEVEAYLQKVLKSSMEGKAELNGSDSEMKTPRKKEKEVRNLMLFNLKDLNHCGTSLLEQCSTISLF